MLLIIIFVLLNILLYIYFKFLKIFIPLFPLSFIRKIAVLKGIFFYYCIPIRKKTAFNNLKIAFPDKNQKELYNIIKKSYINILTVILEFFYLDKLSLDEFNKIVKISNPELFYENIKLNNGLILVSAHFGNWELTAVAGSKILNKKFNVIYKEQTNKLLDKEINKIRTSCGNSMIEMKLSLRPILNALKNNEVVAMLADQSAPKESIKINFFNLEVPAFEGLAKIAIKTKAPVLFGLSVRNDNGSYAIYIHKIDTSCYSEINDENVKILTQQYYNLLTDYIIKYPSQWLWFHKRFKHAGIS